MAKLESSPENVTFVTLHSLALSAMIRHYGHMTTQPDVPILSDTLVRARAAKQAAAIARRIKAVPALRVQDKDQLHDLIDEVPTLEEA